MKKIKISQFTGRQLSRLKAGQSYYMIIMTTITALSLMDMAFPDIDTMFLIILFPCILLGAFSIGYFMDKSNVTTMDHRKTIEMAHRYLTTADFKNNEFTLILIKAIFKWIESTQNKNPVSFDELKEDYKKYLKKWNPPKED